MTPVVGEPRGPAAGADPAAMPELSSMSGPVESVDAFGALTAAAFAEHAVALARRDPALAGVIDAYGVPDFWHRPASFPSLVLFIVEQQVSLASAKAVFDRLTLALGVVTPETLLAAPTDVLVEVGLTRQKQRYIRLLAAAVADGSFDLVGLGRRPDGEVRQALLALTGIGPWTADVYLLSALRRPDIWPTGDRALQVGVAELLELDEVPDPTALERLGERWRPLRAVAARLVWHAYLCRRGRVETIVAGLDP
jgi:DNA-3-methyladenine glycosylase II